MRRWMFLVPVLVSAFGVSAQTASGSGSRTCFVGIQPVFLYHFVDQPGEPDDTGKYETWHYTLVGGYFYNRSRGNLRYCGMSITPPQFNYKEQFRYTGISLNLSVSLGINW